MNIKNKLVLISILTILVLKCLARVSKSDTRSIIGGDAAERYPFYVAMYIYTEKFVYCGGTIVAENAVVSAAHCIWNGIGRWVPPDEVFVTMADFTSPQWTQNATAYKVIEAVGHADYNRSYLQGGNDISLLIIEGKFNMSYNSRLKPCPKDSTYKQAVAIGLGLLQQNPMKETDVLQEAVLYEDPHCSKLPSLSTSEKLICYSDPGKAATCEGDSGGPLVYMKGRRVKCLLGITSWGSSERCEKPSFPGVFTKAGYFEDWINDHLH